MRGAAKSDAAPLSIAVSHCFHLLLVFVVVFGRREALLFFMNLFSLVSLVVFVRQNLPQGKREKILTLNGHLTVTDTQKLLRATSTCKATQLQAPGRRQPLDGGRVPPRQPSSQMAS